MNMKYNIAAGLWIHLSRYNLVFLQRTVILPKIKLELPFSSTAFINDTFSDSGGEQVLSEINLESEIDEAFEYFKVRFYYELHTCINFLTLVGLYLEDALKQFNFLSHTTKFFLLIY